MGNLYTQRISAKYGAVVASYDFRGNSFIDNSGANRETILKRFRCGQDIGVYFLRQYTIGPKLPYMGEAALNLIIDKNSTNFITPIP